MYIAHFPDNYNLNRLIRIIEKPSIIYYILIIFHTIFSKKIDSELCREYANEVCRTRHGMPFMRMMNDSITTRQYRNKTGIPSSSFPITYDHG